VPHAPISATCVRVRSRDEGVCNEIMLHSQIVSSTEMRCSCAVATVCYCNLNFYDAER
jgi:hypothetical protein